MTGVNKARFTHNSVTNLGRGASRSRVAAAYPHLHRNRHEQSGPRAGETTGEFRTSQPPLSPV
jgi:hypothetical protein